MLMWLKLKFMSKEAKRKYFFDNASPSLISTFHYVLNDTMISEDELIESLIHDIKPK